MNGKQTKKLRAMAALFYQMQTPNMPNRKNLNQIYQELKKIHNGKTVVEKERTRVDNKVI